MPMITLITIITTLACHNHGHLPYQSRTMLQRLE
jgi:hypothetical protein